MAKASKAKFFGATQTAASVGYEAPLWQMADALRDSMDAAEYRHVCPSLLFLKYTSDAKDPDGYPAQSNFWVPPEARLQHLKAQARQRTIGQLVDDAMLGVERDNPALKGVLPKSLAQLGLDKQRLGQFIHLISGIALGDSASKSKVTKGCMSYPSSRPRRWIQRTRLATITWLSSAYRSSRRGRFAGCI